MVLAGQPVDRLNGFESLSAWLVQAGTVDEQQANDLERKWKGTHEAETAFQNGVRLRASLREMAERLVKGKTVPQSTVAGINEWLAYQTGHSELKRTRGRFQKRFQADFQEPAQLLW